MPDSRNRRNQPSKQERAALQAAARNAEQERKSRKGLRYVVAIFVVAILFTFGVLGQNLGGKGKKSDVPTVTTQEGAPKCPPAKGSSEVVTYFKAAPGACVDKDKIYDARIETTAGNMTVEIYPGRAYNAANNFIFLARYHFYDGLPFHRVLKDAFAQTGDPVAPGVTGPGYEFPDDGLPASSTQYVKGAILFAHESADSNGSQILFITGPGGTSLNPTFPLFGQVKKGFDVLDRINAAATTNTNMPSIRYAIKSIDVTEHKK